MNLWDEADRAFENASDHYTFTKEQPEIGRLLHALRRFATYKAGRCELGVLDDIAGDLQPMPIDDPDWQDIAYGIFYLLLAEVREGENQ